MEMETVVSICTSLSETWIHFACIKYDQAKTKAIC